MPLGRRRATAAGALLVPLAAAVSSQHASGAMEPIIGSHASVPLCSFDDELISAHLGANATTRSIRKRLHEVGASPPGLDATRETLVRDLAAGFRAMASIPSGARLDNVTALQLGLEAKGEAYAVNEPAAALLERLEQRLEKECFVVNPQRPLALSLALEDLQTAAAERMLTSSGTRVELLDMLYHFQRRCDSLVSRAAPRPAPPPPLVRPPRHSASSHSPRPAPLLTPPAPSGAVRSASSSRASRAPSGASRTRSAPAGSPSRARRRR